jgi:hypothetical protein
MSRARRLAAVVAGGTACLAACADPAWYKAGATTQDYNRDSRECDKVVQQFALPPWEWWVKLPREEVFYRCMVIHGWSYDKNR